MNYFKDLPKWSAKIGSVSAHLEMYKMEGENLPSPPPQSPTLQRRKKIHYYLRVISHPMSRSVVSTADSRSPAGRLPGLFSTGQVALSLRIHRLPAPFWLTESRLSRLSTRATPHRILLIHTLSYSFNKCVSNTCDVHLGCLWWFTVMMNAYPDTCSLVYFCVLISTDWILQNGTSSFKCACLLKFERYWQIAPTKRRHQFLLPPAVSWSDR